jgi:hypothetical protein
VSPLIYLQPPPIPPLVVHRSRWHLPLHDMDAHALAVAALNEVARRPSHPESAADDTPGSTCDSAVRSASAPPTKLQSHSFTREAKEASSTSDNSQNTATDGHESPSTPPTSDGILSQEHESHLAQLSKLAAVQRPLAAPRNTILLDSSPKSRKRTADGLPKLTDTSPIRPTTSEGTRHTRNLSTVSSTSSTASSRVSEVYNCISYPHRAVIVCL